MLLMTALLLVAAPAQGPATGTASASNGPDPNKMICKDINRTGSRLASDRMCMTRSQWDERQREAQKDLRQLQGNMPPCPGNDQDVCGGG